jgi:selenocysteine lyase/cysteine desulfurase
MAAVMADQLDEPVGSMGSAAQCEPEPDLTSTAALLAAGGDGRIVPDSESGRNRYGCRPIPEPGVLAYGSATASTVSCAGFAAADRLRQRLARAARREPAAVTYAREVARIRRELVELCGLSDLPALDVILGASGTDLHAFAAQLVGADGIMPPLAVVVAESETGSGVSAALRDGAAPGATEVATVTVREPDGRPRPPSSIDADVAALVDTSVGSGRSVLLIVTDVSKTGLIAPSPACALALRDRHPMIEIVVDACQFRLTPSTLRAYLEQDVWVALTGSKFVAGPAFSGAMLVQAKAAARLRPRPWTSTLDTCTARADWPCGWEIRSALPDVANYGLLLRWEAALRELRAFRSLAEHAVSGFLEHFRAAISRRLATDPAFEELPLPDLDRRPLVTGSAWDGIPTIFPFLLRRHRRDGSSRLLDRDETARVHRLLRCELGDGATAELPDAMRVTATRPCQVGQPVAVGMRDGRPVSALRLCVSMRNIKDAVCNRSGADHVIAGALSVLDKAAWLAQEVS